MLTWLASNEPRANKLIKAAATYGYMGIGARSGGINGVLELNDSTGDTNLRSQLESERKRLPDDTLSNYLIGAANAILVKIVAHVPTGDRILGLMCKSMHGNADLRAVFFAAGNYSG